MLDSSNAQTQSPEVHFRETDGEFLKQQARLWLEAVLDERFDGETSLADVLVDGEILHRVATAIRSLLRKHADGEPASPKSLFPEAAFYGKHSGKYLPYSNVDSFLKVCQKLGLTGVDLFSPPDVVERKDIRRVCLCIRALSKKAQARQLEVPEFDYVTHTTVAMPTELVGGLRDSLRQASASSSPSGPRGVENMETPEKVGLSPLHLKRPIGPGWSIGEDDFSSSEFKEELGKEPVRSLIFGENDGGAGDTLSAGPQQSSYKSVIDPDMPPVAEEDLGFSSGSREPSSPEASSNEDILHKSLSCDPSKAFSEKVDMAQRDTSERLPPWRASGVGNKDGKASKKVAWVPFMAVAVALLGVFLVIKARVPSIYKVKKGDTLTEISRRTGKSSWEELVRLNPGIRNPDLIYPNERLRLHP